MSCDSEVIGYNKEAAKKRTLCLEEKKKEDDPFRAEGDTSKYKGLCVTCKQRTTCTIHKPESGVWRCAEYK